MRGASRVFAVVAGLALLAAACSSSGGDEPSETGASGGTGASGAPVTGGSYSIVNCEPTTLIPHNDYESCGAQVFQVLFTRLMSFDEDGAPVPAQADSVTASADGLTYTIVIKDGWTFHDGEPVTAQSYVDAWNYTAYGPNGYILNFFFDRVVGYDALNPKKGKPETDELSGLTVVDDTTFTVTLNAPFSQFPLMLGFDAFDPLPQAFYDDPDAFNEQPIGDGPYMMDGPWKHDETVDLKRFADYAGDPGYADAIQLPIYTGDAAWADFQAGNLDITLVGSQHLDEAERDYSDTLQRLPSSSYLYLGLPTYDERFQSDDLRRALSMGMDRAAVIEAILVAETPADDMVAPVVQGYRPGACGNCVLDVAAAQQALQAAGGWTGPLTLSFPGDDPLLAQAMEAVGNQWTQNLGIEVELNPINPNDYYPKVYALEMPGPWWDGWVMDYPSMENYLTPLYGSNGGANTFGYSSEAFDELMEQGDQQATVTDAIPYYQQADDLVLEEMPVLPWGYIDLNTVNQPTVTNVRKAGPLDLIALELVQVVGP